MSIFTDEPASVAVGRSMMYYVYPVIWFYSFIDVYSGAIRGSGQTVPVTVISALTICVFRIAWIELLLPVFNTIDLVFMCYPTSWLLCGSVITWYYYRRSTLHKAISDHSGAVYVAQSE